MKKCLSYLLETYLCGEWKWMLEVYVTGSVLSFMLKCIQKGKGVCKSKRVLVFNLGVARVCHGLCSWYCTQLNEMVWLIVLIDLLHFLQKFLLWFNDLVPLVDLIKLNWQLIPSFVFLLFFEVVLASYKTENMNEESNSKGKDMDLLHQLEDILESDALM